MKKTKIIVLLVALLLVCGCNDKKEEVDYLGIDYSIEENEGSLKYDTENPVVALKVKDYGSIVIELYPDIAPNTVNNFISLVRKGFYDNNSFHRLAKDFVLQGGDPNGNGSGGPGYTIKGEFTNNGFQNDLSHEKYVVSMARVGGQNDSAGSQFFIVLEDAKLSLDGDYASFGKVIDGFDTITDIENTAQVANAQSGKLKNNLVIERALVDTKNKEYEEPKKI